MDWTSLFGETGLGGLDLGKMLSGITDLFKNEGFANLLGGGLGLYNTIQAGNLMDFQKDMYKANEARNQDLYEREKKEEEARHALDF